MHSEGDHRHRKLQQQGRGLSCDAKVNAAGGRRDQEADLEGARAARGPAGRVCDWDGQRPQQPHQHDQWTPQQLAICHRGWRRRWAGHATAIHAEKEWHHHPPTPIVSCLEGTDRQHQQCVLCLSHHIPSIMLVASLLCNLAQKCKRGITHCCHFTRRIVCCRVGRLPACCTKPMAQQRHESVAMALFCFLGVRTGQ